MPCPTLLPVFTILVGECDCEQAQNRCLRPAARSFAHPAANTCPAVLPIGLPVLQGGSEREANPRTTRERRIPTPTHGAQWKQLLVFSLAVVAFVVVHYSSVIRLAFPTPHKLIFAAQHHHQQVLYVALGGSKRTAVLVH
ncbi:unnamed protein product [Calypogeia fissa]